MKLIYTITLILISNVIFGQLTGNIGIGYNRFTNNYNDYKRTNGLTLQFGVQKNLNEYLAINLGVSASLAQENYYKYYNPYIGVWEIDSSTVVTDKSNRYSVSTQFPIKLITTLISDKLYLLSGISLNIDNIAIFGKGFPVADPETANSSMYDNPYNYYLFNWPATGKIGYGYEIGFLYKPTNTVGIYAELKSTKNSSFGFSYIEIGTRFKIFTNR